MRMDEMNKLFEEQGFEVERKWLTEKDCYEFHLRRDGEDWYCHYTYPNGASGAVASKHQKTFVEQTIRNFEKIYCSNHRSLQESFTELLMDFCQKHHITLNSEVIVPGDKVELYFRKGVKQERIDIEWRNIISPMDALTAIERRLINIGMVKDTYIDCKVRNDSLSALSEAVYFMTNYDAGGFAKLIKPVDKKLETRIKDVIFNPPATIVKWDDGTKTVVKVQNGEDYDPEKGLAMAISKKALGNKREYYHTFLHWLKKYEKANVEAEQETKFEVKLPDMSEVAKAFSEMQQKIHEQYAVQKAYDLLVKFRDTSETVSVDDVIGYLGQALEE